VQFERQVAHIEHNYDRLLYQDMDPPDARRLQRRNLK
jgi:hypothetical protein